MLSFIANAHDELHAFYMGKDCLQKNNRGHIEANMEGG